MRNEERSIVNRQSETLNPWTETDSQTFVDYGRYFVPDRELQMQTICSLIPPLDEPFHVLELCCGEGLLAEAILERFPQAILHAYDGSAEMLGWTQMKLAKYHGRFHTHLFNLADTNWRTPSQPFHAIVSSLAIHHLGNAEKQTLYGDLYQMLAPDGAFVLLDVVQPVSDLGMRVAADMWDTAVQDIAQELDGNQQAYHYFSREKWNIYRHPDPMDKPSTLFDQLKWLEQIGFREVDVYWMKAGHTLLGGRK